MITPFPSRCANIPRDIGVASLVQEQFTPRLVRGTCTTTVVPIGCGQTPQSVHEDTARLAFTIDDVSGFAGKHELRRANSGQSQKQKQKKKRKRQEKNVRVCFFHFAESKRRTYNITSKAAYLPFHRSNSQLTYSNSDLGQNIYRSFRHDLDLSG